MASEVAQLEAIDSTLPSEAHLTNGNHQENREIQQKADAYDDNTGVPKPELDVNSSGLPPVEDVVPGITPIADFLPKQTPTSHPTPPPDEPLATSDATMDTEMTTESIEESIVAEELPTSTPQPAAETLPESEPAPTSETVATATISTESSLVRPREEDEEDDLEPAAKRSKVEKSSNLEVDVADVSLSETIAPVPAPADPSLEAPVLHATEPMAGIVESVPDQTMQTVSDEPMKSEVLDDGVAPPRENDAAPAPESMVKPDEPSLAKTEPQLTTEAQAVAPPVVPASETSAGPPKPSYSTSPMTHPQNRFLQEKTKNLKKTKNSTAFLNPVDAVALGIPQYLEVVKNPMDLSTMETKLKSGKYASVQEYADDFQLIISNARRFNGDAHPVTQAGFAMEAYFRKMMESVPSADQPAAPKPQSKKASPKPPSHEKRRESRSLTQAAAPAPLTPAASASTAAGGEAFALQPDGTPQIRRDSTINRPARTIKPPPARELTYSKPKRKEHQLELKFCEHVLNEIRGPKYAQLNHIFQAPVDPVALNIPHYRQIVKQPMDMSTMAQKLKQGQYAKANEFKKDFDLMISNCLAFNPAGNPVRDIGIQFQREFEVLWKNKEKWERNRKADSQRATSASADDDDSGDGEDDEEEEDVVDGDQNATIAALQKQLRDMQSALAGLGGKIPKPPKKSKSTVKPASKKASLGSAAPKQKVAPKGKAPKKAKQVTYEEKQEISEAVGRMSSPQVEELTRIITTNCKKYADQEEMELEIDDLPNDVQGMLLRYVRSLFGNPNRGARAASPDDGAGVDDDDFEPVERGSRKSGGGSKRKKHKPMGKKEQQDAISNLQKKLSQFQGGPTSGSQSPSSYAVQDDTSGDEESEESEEE